MSSPDTGNLATAAFGTSNFAVDIIRMGSFSMTRQVLNRSHLLTQLNEHYGFGDLVELGKIEMEYFFDPDFRVAAKKPPFPTIQGSDQAMETITITSPVQSGDSTGLILSGNGGISDFDIPELANNQYQTSTFMIQWEGGASGPTWTDPT